MIDMSFIWQVARPQDLVTLQWIIITALVSTVVFLFRQWQKSIKENAENQVELLEKTLVGLSDAGEVIHGLTEAIEAMQRRSSIVDQIAALREELHEHTD